MRVRIVSNGVLLFSQVIGIWSDGEKLRVQHGRDHITVIELSSVREIERIDDNTTSPARFGWADRRLQEAA